MKEPTLAFNKGPVLTEGFTHRMKSFVVFSKRFLIHPDSFQPKI